MKICIVSQTFAPQPEGGAEISSRYAAKNLSKRHDVVVLALGKAGIEDAPVGECRSGEAYRVHRIAFENSYLPLPQRPETSAAHRAIWHSRNALGAVSKSDLLDFLRREMFDLVYAQNSSRMQPAVYRAADALGIPVVQHLRDYALLCPRTSMFRNGQNCTSPCMSCKLLTARARRASESVGTVIAVSDFVRQRFVGQDMFSKADFHVLHNTNTAEADFSAELLAVRPAPEPVFTFGYLGALSEEKGVERLVEAFLSLPLNLPAKLLMAGRGQDAFVTSMKDRTAHLPAERIEWLGQVRPEDVYARSEVVIVPSVWHEPQGRTLIEAAVYGVPAFAANTGGTPEVVQLQRTGLCYDAQDSAALAGLMIDAAKDGSDAWRARLGTAFPGLSGFAGTAEATGYYERLESLLQAAVGSR